MPADTWVDLSDDAEPDTRPAGLRALGLQPHSDDPDLHQRWLYSKQTNTVEGYVADEIVLSHTWREWALGIEISNVDLSSYQKDSWWRGVSLRVGPFSLAIARQKGTL